MCQNLQAKTTMEIMDELYRVRGRKYLLRVFWPSAHAGVGFAPGFLHDISWDSAAEARVEE